MTPADDHGLRTRAYARNRELDALIAQLDGMLGQLPGPACPGLQRPLVLILGAPRSGTTLISQWLASTGLFCYPSNFMSRFAAAPQLGALLQRMLFEKSMRFMDEFDDLPVAAERPFASDLGKTRGTLAPHEFWYFWRRFFEFPELPVSGEVFRRSARFDGFAAACGSIQQVFGRALFMKALIANPYAAELARALPKVFLLHIQRDPLDNTASILQSRRRYFGNDSEWWSFKPAEFPALSGLAPAAQAAGQVRYLNEAIERELARIDDSRYLQVQYETLCESPQSVYAQLVSRLAPLGLPDDLPYGGPAGFAASTGRGLSADERAAAVRMLG